MSELLFEVYGAPSVCYGIDAVFSYYQNSQSLSDALLVSASHSATHVLPFVDRFARALQRKCLTTLQQRAVWQGSASEHRRIEQQHSLVSFACACISMAFAVLH